jgi:hypothetical protein
LNNLITAIGEGGEIYIREGFINIAKLLQHYAEKVNNLAQI